MEKPKNIQNKDLYNAEEAQKRHTPPKKPSDNVPKDGLYPNKKEINPS